MKNAIVTGASSGIGKEITQMLAENGYKVFAIGRNFGEENENENIVRIRLDLTDIYESERIIKKIRKENDINLLVNNAGIGYFGLHEELNVKKIDEMVKINFEVPMILCQILLRDLKKNSGTIINISSVTAEKNNTYGCAYGATKAGISSFGKSLFDEARKYGVKVVEIRPDMTKSNFYRNADFKECNDEDKRIESREIADAVKWIIGQRDGIAVTELTVRPQKHGIERKI
ncbi:MAG: SDR family oxidoreductase [Firmicutes bacterium]|nr:SDR family oxidoreductase [Bacillota bacterium]